MKTGEPVLHVEGLSKMHNGRVRALENVTFSVGRGEIMAVIGNSGGGKSTLLRLIAGFEMPDTGEVRMEGKVLSTPASVFPPAERGIGMIFQDYALFPHMTVRQNVRYGYKPRRGKPDQTPEALMELCGLTGLEKRYPHELSGGQQQKTALARALAAGPKLLLMDEPFNSIDILAKEELRSDLRQLLKFTGTTAMVVSHDYRDVFVLADTVLVLNDGRQVQAGIVEDVYRRPVNAYVAQLFGECNVLKGIMEQGRWKTPFGAIPLPGNLHVCGNTAFIRPDRLKTDEKAGYIKGTITEKHFCGAEYRYILQAGDQQLIFYSPDPGLEPGVFAALRLC